MEYFKRIWFWFLSLICRGPQDEEDPIEHGESLSDVLGLPEVDDEEGGESETMLTERLSNMSKQRNKKIARVIEVSAETFERDQRAFVSFLAQHDRQAVLDAIDHYVDWEALFNSYPDDLVELIYSRGTNIQLNMAHARLMRDMAQAERRERGLLKVELNDEGLTTGGKP